jgi:hypothetical protein
MVLNAPFNNISVISFRSVLLLKETGGLFDALLNIDFQEISDPSFV